MRLRRLLLAPGFLAALMLLFAGIPIALAGLALCIGGSSILEWLTEPPK